tara:strand:+ start:350 stop:1987 length:1638 start_codon:yes stop_codon:yes gene_type:complete
MSKTILSVQNLCVSYITKDNPIEAVKNVSFDIKKGEIFGLVGESGSGKSTVVQALLRTLPPPGIISGGQAFFDKKNIFDSTYDEIMNFRWKEISIVLQSALNALNPVLQIRDQIKDVLEIHTDSSEDEIDKRINELLLLVDIDATRLDSYPHQLSGGMKQRIVLAIALALMPPIIIMDEPTTALDVIVERSILSKIIDLRKELGFTILFITHDLNLLLEFADRLAVMKDGKIIDLGDAKDIKSGGSHSYTEKLISALPYASGPRKKGLLSKPKEKIVKENPLLEVVNLSKSFAVSGFFKPQMLDAVKNVNFKIYPGEILGIVGESGSGKSTIGKLVTRLIRPTDGIIRMNGKDILSSKAKKVSLDYRKKVQMVFQDPFGSLNSIHTIYHHLSRPLIRHRLKTDSEIHNYVIDLLESVGLKPGMDFANKFPHEMSGGERQRVAIARALSLGPELIVADEPTSMLDVSIRMEILEIFAQMRIKKNLAIIFITHDLASARYLADRIIVLKNGQIVEKGISEELIQSAQTKYTKQLVKAASPGWLKNKK